MLRLAVSFLRRLREGLSRAAPEPEPRHRRRHIAPGQDRLPSCSQNRTMGVDRSGLDIWLRSLTSRLSQFRGWRSMASERAWPGAGEWASGAEATRPVARLATG